MVGMNGNEIRQKYIDLMVKNGHKVIKPAKLILEGDSTTLFTGSGMQPLMPYLLGKEHPSGERLVNSQPCVRAQDIEDVGDNRHTTCFEMLGNWSLGDYFKEEQIRQFFRFLVDEVGLKPEKIYVSCFIGDEKYGIPKDTEAADIWKKVFREAGIEAEAVDIGSAKDGDERGIKPGERIFFYDDHENWWSRNGGLETTPVGDPCGPDSEIFYDFGEQHHDASYGKAHPASDSGRFIEIGNQVFMQYRKLEDGSFEPLAKRNVDFGGGLERIAAAAIDTPDVFRTSLFMPVLDKLEELCGKKYESNKSSMRVVADHLKGAVWLASQGLVPSNKEQGYVMRRLVRRAVIKALDLGVEGNFFEQVVPVVAGIYKDYYAEIGEKQDEIVQVLTKEEKIFRQTLTRGLKEMRKLAPDGLTGREIFMLHDTYGFPMEISVEEAFRQGIDLSENWKDEFNVAMSEQRERSKTAEKGKFKGGLAGHSDTEVKYHTVAHILLEALKRVLGTEIVQRGSNINQERVRFDFAYPEKLTPEQINAVEEMVNDTIYADLSVTFGEHSLKEAKEEMHANGVFDDKYGDVVKVYVVGGESEPFSVEICGGPHVENTAVIHEDGKRFKIIKEESSSAGVRRIKGVLV